MQGERVELCGVFEQVDGGLLGREVFTTREAAEAVRHLRAVLADLPVVPPLDAQSAVLEARAFLAVLKGGENDA